VLGRGSAMQRADGLPADPAGQGVSCWRLVSTGAALITLPGPWAGVAGNAQSVDLVVVARRGHRSADR